MIYTCSACNRDVRLTNTRHPHPARAHCPHCEKRGTLYRRLPAAAGQQPAGDDFSTYMHKLACRVRTAAR